MEKTKEKAKKQEKKEKKSVKAPKRVLRKVETGDDSVAFVSKPDTGLTPTQEEKVTTGTRTRKSRPKPTEGEVRVISFDRIVLSKKWTEQLGLKQGDSLRIRREDESLILTK